MWRKLLNANGLGLAVKRFEIFLSVHSEERGILRHPILDHLQPNAGKSDGIGGKRKERCLVNLVLRIILALNADSLALDIFNVEIFFPTIRRADLFQNV